MALYYDGSKLYHIPSSEQEEGSEGGKGAEHQDHGLNLQ